MKKTPKTPKSIPFLWIDNQKYTFFMKFSIVLKLDRIFEELFLRFFFAMKVQWLLVIMGFSSAFEMGLVPKNGKKAFSRQLRRKMKKTPKTPKHIPFLWIDNQTYTFFMKFSIVLKLDLLEVYDLGYMLDTLISIWKCVEIFLEPCKAKFFDFFMNNDENMRNFNPNVRS